MTKIVVANRGGGIRASGLRMGVLSQTGIQIKLLLLALISPVCANEMLTDLVARGDLRAVKVALDKGASPNTTNSSGDNALFLAVNRGRLELVRILLQQGADANITNRVGMSPLALASLRGYQGIAAELIAYGARASKILLHRRFTMQCY